MLAHPPGTGKGQNTTLGLKDYLRADPDPGYIVWAALRKGQIADQDGLPFVALHGRQKGNCRKLPEAQELSHKGYGVRAGLCQYGDRLQPLSITRVRTRNYRCSSAA